MTVRFLSLALVCAGALGLNGCNSKPAETTSGGLTPTEATSIATDAYIYATRSSR
jgi:hypothetical protein